MSNKVDKWTYNRILELIYKQGLTQKIVAERLGISTRTIRIYLKKHKEETCTTPQP